MNNDYPYYAIENNNDRSYCIKQVFKIGLVTPVDRVAYRTLQEAIAVTDQMNIKIKKIGSIYEII